MSSVILLAGVSFTPSDCYYDRGREFYSKVCLPSLNGSNGLPHTSSSQRLLSSPRFGFLMPVREPRVFYIGVEIAEAQASYGECFSREDLSRKYDLKYHCNLSRKNFREKGFKDLAKLVEVLFIPFQSSRVREESED